MPKYMVPILLLLTALLAPASARAGSNDVVLSRLASFEPMPCAASDGVCGQAKPNQELFERLAHDLGEVFAPRLMAPAETLGEAGFAVSVMGSYSFIPSEEAHWQEAIEDNDPPEGLWTGHLQVRKGLPFSLELAGNLSYLQGSEMIGLGVDLKGALLEGYRYLPDVAVRGSVNTIVGAEYLNLINAGWDASISKDFGIANVFSIAPYAGYQNLYVISSSRLINAYPQDPRPPTTSEEGDVFAPEFVFAETTERLDRYFVGARLNVWTLSFVLQGTLGEEVDQLTFSAGFDF